MIVTLQDPYTGDTHKLDLDDDSTVRDIALQVVSDLSLDNTPQFFTYFKQEHADELSSRTIVDGEKVVLPDDLTATEIMAFLRDPELPVYYQSKDIDENLLFQFRTDRLNRAGYDTDLLNEKCVLLCGVGLLGNEIAMNLAVLGVGKIILMDYGHVDWYNIYRQPLFGRDDVYKTKVEAVSDKLNGMGKIDAEPVYVEIPCLATEPDKIAVFERLKTINSHVKASDLVIGALDIFSGRAVAQILARHNGKPFVSSSVDAWGGKTNVYFPDENNCYCCGISPGSFADGGACTLAAIEAQKTVVAMATRFSVDCLLGKDIEFNEIKYYAGKMELKKSKVMGTPKCRICGDNGLKAQDNKQAFEFIYNWLFGKVS